MLFLIGSLLCRTQTLGAFLGATDRKFSKSVVRATLTLSEPEGSKSLQCPRTSQMRKRKFTIALSRESVNRRKITFKERGDSIGWVGEPPSPRTRRFLRITQHVEARHKGECPLGGCHRRSGRSGRAIQRD